MLLLLHGHAPGEVGQELRDGLVRDRVDAHLTQLLLEPRVPVVLDIVVGAARQLCGDQRPPACKSEISRSNLELSS
jgi:hypothetical protein